MTKDLKYFMRDTKPEIVTVPGPASFKNENGEVIDFEIKVLTQSEIQKINDKYRKHSIATDKKGNPIVSGNEVVWKTERDNARSARHLVVEALQYPNLKDKELMEFYKCVDVTEMPLLVFPKAEEFAYVTKIVMTALGLNLQDLSEDEEDTDEVDEAKN